MVRSVFHRSRFASEELVGVMHHKFQDRKWKKGVLRTLRGTVGHSVAPLLPLVSQSALVIWGAQDRVLTDLPGAIRAGEQIRRARQVVIPKCGHAPQIERARLVNRLVSQFLRDKLKSIPPALTSHPSLAREVRSFYSGNSAGAPAHAVQRTN